MTVCGGESFSGRRVLRDRPRRRVPIRGSCGACPSGGVGSTQGRARFVTIHCAWQRAGPRMCHGRRRNRRAGRCVFHGRPCGRAACET
eukprot:14499254-Alexandrium_andersonii.AAC.1